jgi:exosome complex component RRP43
MPHSIKHSFHSLIFFKLGSAEPMQSFSQEELDFVRSGIRMDRRTDLRRSHEQRETSIFPSRLAQSDGSVRVCRGMSEVEVSMQYKETDEMLTSLSLAGKGAAGAQPVESNMPLPSLVLGLVTGFLGRYKIGLRLHINIINNDGSLYDLVVTALQSLFREVEVPDIWDLTRVVRTGLEIPAARTFAVINGTFVNDPCRIEEAAAEGIVHVLIGDGNRIHGCCFDKGCTMDAAVLRELLETLAS